MSEVSIFKTFLSLLEVLGIKLAIFPFTSGHNFFFSFCGGGGGYFPFLKRSLELWVGSGLRAAENMGKEGSKCHFYLLRNSYF